jgi:hypothetical protein
VTVGAILKPQNKTPPQVGEGEREMPSDIDGWLWWLFSAVLVGFLMNVTAHYSTGAIDKLVGEFVESWKIVSEKRKQELEEALSRMLRDPVEATYQGQRLTRAEVRILTMLDCTNVLFFAHIWLS